jgi:Asp-tRNA(Asn)/Glu-tRNA(Gln) amidotransferase B subunit
MLENGGDPGEIAARRGIEALDSGSLSPVVAEVVAAHPAEWARYAAGEDKLVGFFTGHVMRATGNRANGKAVAEELRRLRDTAP